MKIKILLISGFLFLVSLFLLFRYYTHAEEKSIAEDIKRNELLVASGKETLATYDSVYTEYSRRGKVKSITIKYRFEAEGKMFEDEQTLPAVPEDVEFTLVYLPSDPTIHGVEPQKALEGLKARQAEGTSSTFPWSLFVISLGVFVLTLRSHRKDLQQRAEDEQFYREQAARMAANRNN